MMRHISIAKTAMSAGALFAVSSTIWVVLIGVGWAQQILDFILELSFLTVPYQLAPYSAVTGMSLVAIAFCAGALSGAIFAVVWNSLTVEEERELSRELKQSMPAK